MSYEKDHKEFVALVAAWARLGMANRGSRHARPRYADVRVIDDIALHRTLKSEVGELDGAIVLPAPPIADFVGWTVFLWAKWEFSERSQRAKVEVGFIKDRANAYYFRFEHGPAEGKHRYWHSQFTPKFSALESPPSRWAVHNSTPAFPIACANCAGLLVVAAISLYGASLDAGLMTTINSISLRDDYLRNVLRAA